MTPGVDPELDGFAALASRLCGAPASVTLGHELTAGAVPLRGSDGIVRGGISVDGSRLDPERHSALGRLAAQAGALLERRERELGLLDAVERLLLTNDELAAFAGRVAHDLRSPLTALLGFLALADGPFGEAMPPRAAECVRAASAAATRMRTLVDDLLAYATFDPRPQVGPVDLPGLVEAVTADLADEIRATGAAVTYTGPAQVLSDATLLRQLLQNLVGNALTHGTPGTPPRVRVDSSDAEGSWYLQVSDNGPGVPVEHRARIFEPLVRLRAHGDVRGTGVGLSTCARIAEALGATITVGDADGGGAAFRLTVPAG